MHAKSPANWSHVWECVQSHLSSLSRARDKPRGSQMNFMAAGGAGYAARAVVVPPRDSRSVIVRGVGLQTAAVRTSLTARSLIWSAASRGGSLAAYNSKKNGRPERTENVVTADGAAGSIGGAAAKGRIDPAVLEETPAQAQDEPKPKKSAAADLASLVASLRGAEDDSDAVTLIYDTTWKAAFVHHTAMQPAAVKEKDEDMVAVQQQQDALHADDSAWKVKEMEDALFCGDDGASPRQMKAVKIPVAAPLAFCLSNGAGDYDNPAKMPFCNYILPCGGAATLHDALPFPAAFFVQRRRQGAKRPPPAARSRARRSSAHRRGRRAPRRGRRRVPAFQRRAAAGASVDGRHVARCEDEPAAG